MIIEWIEIDNVKYNRKFDCTECGFSTDLYFEAMCHNGLKDAFNLLRHNTKETYVCSRCEDVLKREDVFKRKCDCFTSKKLFKENKMNFKDLDEDKRSELVSHMLDGLLLATKNGDASMVSSLTTLLEKLGYFDES